LSKIRYILKNTNLYDVIIVGGGAAGFFSAINMAEKKPSLRILILERGKEVLEKVRISGGGRCNVTHACFTPKELSKFYPRGEKELLGPFHSFCSGDTVDWFEKRGVALKIEDDNRMFPTSDSSQTIIDCFSKLVKKYQIEVKTSTRVDNIFPPNEHNTTWQIKTQLVDFQCHNLVVAAGSNPNVWQLLAKLGHTIVPPVPSLFTFNIKDSRLTDLLGISVEKVTAEIVHLRQKAEGPMLITHWGLSGPAILRLSAWSARELHTEKYNFTLRVNWLHHQNFYDIREELNALKQRIAKKDVQTFSPFGLPSRLWKRLCEAAEITENKKWAEINKGNIAKLAAQLVASEFQVNGKSTFKEEFVTAGGVALKEIDFKRFESKIHKNLFIVGECLDIDAITGGFNFQAAWTGAYLVAQAVATTAA
jgi:predicted Rossmann fold flavoprotein